jgi:hypothetical protein
MPPTVPPSSITASYCIPTCPGTRWISPQHLANVGQAARDANDSDNRHVTGTAAVLAGRHPPAVQSPCASSPQSCTSSRGTAVRSMSRKHPIPAGGAGSAATKRWAASSVTCCSTRQRDLTSSRQKSAPNLRRLLSFYASTAGAEAKIVVRHDFEAIAERNEVPKAWADFGIYDNSLLYVTEHEMGDLPKTTFVSRCTLDCLIPSGIRQV